MQVQSKKIESGKSEVEFLGYELRSGGSVSAERYLRERRRKVGCAIETKRELQSLLGTLNVARNFIP